MIRLVLAEDQAMVRGALCALLRLEGGFEVVAEVGDGEAAWSALQAHAPDLLVTDIEMPVLTGLELAQRVHEAKLATRVVILTTFQRAGYLRRALAVGVRGYLLKDAPSAQLAAALRQVQAGGRAIDPQLAVEALGAELDPLTERERQILRLAGEGVKTGDIAQRLGLSPGTVRNYLSLALGKLGAANRIEGYRVARAKGLL